MQHQLDLHVFCMLPVDTLQSWPLATLASAAVLVTVADCENHSCSQTTAAQLRQGVCEHTS
jgi:hypothetical protein